MTLGCPGESEKGAGTKTPVVEGRGPASHNASGAGKHPGANKNDNSCQSPREGIGVTIGNVLSEKALGVGVGGQARDRGER